MEASLIKPKKCVYFVGPGSTGKTTLTKALFERCTPDTFMLTEVARTVLGKLKYTADDISNDPTKCYALQKAILLAQYHKENELLDEQRKYISDRCAIDPIVYAEFFIKNDTHDSLLNLNEWQEMKMRYQDEKRSLIVLIEPNDKFLKDDGTRKMPVDLEEWKSFYKCFVKFMKSNDIPFKIIPSCVTNICHRCNLMVEWLER